MLKYLLLALLMSLALPALATEQPSVDPRIAVELVKALQAGLALKDAIIKATQEDAAKREKEWADYSKPLWDQKNVP